MQVYNFKMLGENISVDVESGNFFQTDALTSEAIRLMSTLSRKEVLSRLEKKYKHKPIKKLLDSLYSLKSKKMLLSDKQCSTDKIKRRITDLTLNITNHCNLRCRYCWNEAGAYGSNTTNDQKMDKKTAFKAVDLSFSRKCLFPNFMLPGAEKRNLKIRFISELQAN